MDTLRRLEDAGAAAIGVPVAVRGADRAGRSWQIQSALLRAALTDSFPESQTYFPAEPGASSPSARKQYLRPAAEAFEEGGRRPDHRERSTGTRPAATELQYAKLHRRRPAPTPSSSTCSTSSPPTPRHDRRASRGAAGTSKMVWPGCATQSRDPPGGEAVALLLSAFLEPGQARLVDCRSRTGW